MRKHRKHHTTKRRVSGTRRHKMGAAGDFTTDAMQVGGILVAAIGGTMIARSFAAVNPKIVSAAEMIGGFMIKRSAVSPFMEGLGWGLIGAGAVSLSHEFGIISGLDDLVSGMGGNDMIEGIRNDQFISGVRNDAYIGAPDTEEAPHHKDLAELFHAEGLNG